MTSNARGWFNKPITLTFRPTYEEDDMTGVDYDSLYCEAEDGTITLPGSEDKKMKSAAFCLPKKNNVLHFADRAGNACVSELEFSRDRKK